MYGDMVRYYYVSVLHLYGYSVSSWPAPSYNIIVLGFVWLHVRNPIIYDVLECGRAFKR